ncbi:FliI/YscN family ATPase [Herbaspirillum sp. RTI4]|uniref:FliI/YscN family ATPase n=1 Tax=Herbaspirillum sp. RTI4 TaxID=3048640 RepID=UPI002AB45AA1|nr:FliI/YscN family ATPase [Herbaspirillum sp. RTI4]MDY7577161.1 FliI/YscN family ATPase [Herbaspirillum sp. RTI4]MEA9980451.1 FliI/YscN family ATPase [Herbaspirillum sp. RTI4]
MPMTTAQQLEVELEGRRQGRSFQTRGRVSRVTGLMIHASGVHAEIGELCELHTPGRPVLLAETVGFVRQTAMLSAYGSTQGLCCLTEVVPLGRLPTCAVGQALLGRVIDGFGQPMDGGGPIRVERLLPVLRQPPNPLRREMIRTVFPTGVRAIDGLMTVGRGQRIGIFAPAGTGKSTLLGMLAQGAQADIVVVALVGERGREVREFLEHGLSPETRRKTVLVVATSDRPALERVRCSFVATTIAEYFRDQGRSVLLLVDSLTRFARAQREIGLAAGEPPTRRAYPPSLFALLPLLLERAGCSDQGAMTAFYTVLSEADLEQDPVAEEVRSLLDGHIILSRKVAAGAHYPAIDLLASLSRVMEHVVTREHVDAAAYVRKLLAKYEEIELLVQIGEYQQGADPVADEALRLRSRIMEFAAQRSEESDAFDWSQQQLLALAAGDVAATSSAIPFVRATAAMNRGAA